ncbi:MAG: trypsin-like peptidase domain-containing protein [Clostridiales bacterium]|nr:trypsin-like peptidase domain-containing protein [Clostridiales bacterium]
MDNNQYNNGKSSDSFYSYGNSQNNAEQEKAPYRNSGAYQSGTYQGSPYQNGSYQNSYGSFRGQGNREPEKTKEKKSGGFGIKLVKCAALALVFGLVSGVVFQGVQVVSNTILGVGGSTIESEKGTAGGTDTQLEPNASIGTTAISKTYVATDVSDVVSEIMPSIVAITNISKTEYQSFWGGVPRTYESSSAGSGIIVGQNENYLYIATNNHVVEGSTSLTVTFSDDTTVSAEVKGTAPYTDLAVIQVENAKIESGTLANIKVATLGNSDALKVGEASIAIGNALGYGQSVTMGCISALNREVSVSDSSSNTSYTAELIQTDAAINPGNSGGALLNAAGEVIGINSVKYSSTSVEGIGYAIPINTAMPIIEDLITKDKVDSADRAYLGIAGVDVTKDVSEAYKMPQGLHVAQVVEGSAAEQAGIQVGDIITYFDGKAIRSMQELSSSLEYYKAGETVEVTIQRLSDGQYAEYKLSVTLGKKM